MQNGYTKVNTGAGSWHWNIILSGRPAMAEYDDLDDATLQQMLSDATSYEERATLRQALRKRKKGKGGSASQSKARGNSVYNRFAGSTATKTKAPAKDASDGAARSVVPNKSKQEVPASIQETPDPATPTEIVMPIPDPATPTEIVTPIPTPTPPPTPDPSVEEATEACDEEADGTPVTTEPVEDEEPYDGGETDGTPESAVDEQEDIVPQEITQDNVDEQPGTCIEEEEPTVSTKHGHSSDNFGLSMDSTDGSKLTTEPIGSGANLHRHLVAYVNQELFLDPPLPSRGKALFDTCSDPTSLCKLINRCVSGTVDMRALSKVSGSSSQRSEAVQDNMTLAIESARAIGCHIDDSTAENILHKDPETINKLLLDLIRARVVHMPGMDDEPASTFTDLHSLFQKLHISVDDEPASWRDNPEKNRKAHSPPSNEGSSDLTYEERAALRKAEREQRLKEKEAKENSVGLTYEERSVQRKAEREIRRKEREALAK